MVQLVNMSIAMFSGMSGGGGGEGGGGGGGGGWVVGVGGVSRELTRRHVDDNTLAKICLFNHCWVFRHLRAILLYQWRFYNWP